MDNPVYYVQYAHARIASIGRKAAAEGIARLPDPRHRPRAARARARGRAAARARAVSRACVEEAARLRAPHRVTAWVRDFAKTFHGFYRDCRVLSDDAALTQARLWLAEACRLALAERARDPRRARARRDDAPRRGRRRARDDAAPRSTSGCSRAAPRSTTPGGLTIGRRRARPSWPTTHGTPLYVYDEDELRARCARLPDGVRSADGAMRACRTRRRRSCAWRWRALVADAGLDLDVATGGERTSRTGRLPPRAHGVPRQQQVGARAAARARAGCRAPRRRRLRRARPHRGAGRGRPAAARVCCCASRPGVEAHTHEHIATGAEDSKFGFTVSNGSRARRGAHAPSPSDAMDLARLPLPHRFADPRRSSRYALAADVLATLAADVARRDRARRWTSSTSVAASASRTPPTTSRRCRRIADFGAFVRARTSPTPAHAPRSTPCRAHGRGRALHRRHRRASRSTAWAPSRRSPACAPTSRSTAG